MGLRMVTIGTLEIIGCALASDNADPADAAANGDPVAMVAIHLSPVGDDGACIAMCLVVDKEDCRNLGLTAVAAQDAIDYVDVARHTDGGTPEDMQEFVKGRMAIRADLTRLMTDGQ